MTLSLLSLFPQTHPGRRRVSPEQQQILPQQSQHQGEQRGQAGLRVQAGLQDILTRVLPSQVKENTKLWL